MSSPVPFRFVSNRRPNLETISLNRYPVGLKSKQMLSKYMKPKRNETRINRTHKPSRSNEETNERNTLYVCLSMSFTNKCQISYHRNL